MFWNLKSCGIAHSHSAEEMLVRECFCCYFSILMVGLWCGTVAGHKEIRELAEFVGLDTTETKRRGVRCAVRQL